MCQEKILKYKWFVCGELQSDRKREHDKILCKLFGESFSGVGAPGSAVFVLRYLLEMSIWGG